MECYNCLKVAGFNLVFSTRIDYPPEINFKAISMCCRHDLQTDTDGRPMDFPSSELTQSPEETLKNFMSMRENVIAKGKWGGVEGINRDKKFACYHCKEWQKADWNFITRINFINLSIYPSPCQCNCCYCSVYRKSFDKNNDKLIASAYEKIFETLRLAKTQKLIETNADWYVSSGEITIHPFKKDILDLVKGEKVRFFTNGFIFDEDIARELHDNPMASINISIDSGTAETWHKVKGVNNFNRVIENLMMYRKFANHAEQITIKYIILPGINDSDNDFISCVQILKNLGVSALKLSRDARIVQAMDRKTSSDKVEMLDETIVNSGSRLANYCLTNGIKPLFTVGEAGYTPKETEKILQLADKILEK